MIIAIDFDGTVVENDFPKIGKLKQEAVSFIRTAKAAGHTLILYTNRCGDRLAEAVAFLKSNDIETDFVNENTPELIKFFGNDSRKIFADVYIDDHNAGGLQFPVLKIKNAHEEEK